MIVRRAPEGNIIVKQMIELGVLPLLYQSLIACGSDLLFSTEEHVYNKT